MPPLSASVYNRSRHEGGRCRKCLLLISRVPMHICDMLLGYARVSTDDQDLTLQKTALKAAGCRRTFEEKVSGAKRARPELDRMLEQLRDDDVVVVTRLDRLARSTRDLLDIAEKLNEAGAGCARSPSPGRHDHACGTHGAHRVRRHRGVRARADPPAYQFRPRGSHGARREVRA
ncbi:hypothetical protein SPKIRA_37200 (plasmid) [Sphingomonas paucimobilis]|nr:hypothetical protein SPKIRA_37200 [Sphingomonas paucimobilis]